MATWDFNDEQANLLDVLEMAEVSGPQRIKRGAAVLCDDGGGLARGDGERGENVVPIRKTG